MKKKKKNEKSWQQKWPWNTEQFADVPLALCSFGHSVNAASQSANQPASRQYFKTYVKKLEEPWL